MQAEHRTQIESIVGTPIQNARSLSGGMIGEVYRVEFADDRVMVAKVGNLDATLDIEGYMLGYLHEYSDLPVPEVYYSNDTLLLMSFIEGNSRIGTAEQRHAADLLVDLHNVRGEYFGLERDTLIGSLHQPNLQMDSWIDFFREQRLLYMGKVALESGKLPKTVFTRLHTFAENIESWLREPEYPSLIHGDLWTTNILTNNGRVTGFVDPAIYYAHPEIELAFATLFGTMGRTFGSPFFQRYHELRPISPGFFEERRDIYNLYPLLVHVRLFGGGYVGSVDATLRQYGY